MAQLNISALKHGWWPFCSVCSVSKAQPWRCPRPRVGAGQPERGGQPAQGKGGAGGPFQDEPPAPHSGTCGAPVGMPLPAPFPPAAAGFCFRFPSRWRRSRRFPSCCGPLCHRSSSSKSREGRWFVRPPPPAARRGSPRRADSCGALRGRRRRERGTEVCGLPAPDFTHLLAGSS